MWPTLGRCTRLNSPLSCRSPPAAGLLRPWLDLNQFLRDPALSPWIDPVVCAFLPGDSLLFTAGLLVGTCPIQVNILFLAAAAFAAAFAGDQCAYLIGRKAGPAIFKKTDSGLLNREYVDRTHGYFVNTSRSTRSAPACGVWAYPCSAIGLDGTSG